jgi:phage terminase large subunit
LQVSRADVPYDRIIEYPNGFLKLPIVPYLQLLDVEPIPSQIAMINAVNNPKYRFICGALSRRQGKTFVSNIIGQLVSLVPGSNVLIMSPNYSLSQISFDLQRQLIRRFDLEVVRDNAKDKIIELSNGSTVRMGSVNQVDSCVGRSYDLIIFDEAALADGREAFDVALRPTLDKPNSKAIFISTPRGKNNWFAEFYYRGFSELYPQWCSIHATYMDNPRASVEDIEDARRSNTKAHFEQEYMASFNVYEGQIWNFNADCIVTSVPAGLEIFGGLDVGFRDPTAFVICGYDWDTRNYYVLAEYKQAERTTEQHAIVIRELAERWGCETIFIDAAAQQTKFDFAQNFDISTVNAKKSVLDGIAAVGVLMDLDRLFIMEDCKDTLASIDQYQWDTGGTLQREKPKHNDASHIADALRYALYSFRESNVSF